MSGYNYRSLGPPRESIVNFFLPKFVPPIQHHRETSNRALSIYIIYTSICQKTLDIGVHRHVLVNFHPSLGHDGTLLGPFLPGSTDISLAWSISGSM